MLGEAKRRLLLPICIFISAAAATAQQSSSILGTVTDQVDAVVANATVTVTEPSTGATHNAQTNAAGLFRVLDLPAGQYAVHVQVSGFKALEINDVALDTAQERDLGKLRLQIGAVTEQIAVTAEATPVQTSSSERASDIEGSQLNEVGLKGRDTIGFLGLIPGVVDSTADRSLASAQSMAGISINGLGNASINYQVDGVNAMDMAAGGGPPIYINPSMDAVGELKVMTNGYQAEYGRNSGGIVNAVTKAGTRDFHGSAFWEHRSEDLNANTFFNNRSNVLRPIYRYFVGGGTIGGPVYIPKHFNANKSKLFFFYSEEYTRVAQPTVTATANEPTAAQRGGNFAQTFAANGTLIPVKDPNTGVQFPGNIVPPSRIDPTGLGYLNFLPLPNGYVNPAPGQQFTANYINSQTPSLRRRDDIARIDYNPTSKLFIYGRYAHDINNTVFVDSVSAGLGTYVQGYPGTSYVVDAVYTIAPTLINEFKFGFGQNHKSFLYAGATDGSAYYRTSTLNPPRLNPVPTGSLYLPYVPYAVYAGGSGSGFVNFQDYLGGGAQGAQGIPNATGGGANQPLPYQNANHTLSYQDDLTWVKGEHTFKAGLYLEFSRKYEPAAGGDIYQGAFNFGSTPNNPLDTGYGYANALLGVFQTYEESSNRLVPIQTFHNAEFYVQDNWRINERLTLDYGVRFYQIGLEQDSGTPKSIAYFYPQLFKASSAPVIYSETTVGGKTVALNPLTGATASSSLYNTLIPGSGNSGDGFAVNGLTGNGDFTKFPKIVVAPRLGLAWKATSDGKTSVRASFGIFPDRPNQNWLMGRGSAPAAYLNFVYNSTISQIPAAAAAAAVSPLTGYALESGSQRVPHSIQWNFTAQRAIGFDTVVDIGYVGNVDRNAMTVTGVLNPIPQGIYGTPAALFNGAELNPNLLRTSYQGLGTINTQCDCLSDLNYHALQTAVNHRMTHGLQFGTSFVWSKALGSSGIDPYHNAAWMYGPTLNDRKFVTNLQFVYQIPTLMPNNKFAKAVLGDWTLSSITHINTGAPVTPACSSSNGAVSVTDPSLTGVGVYSTANLAGYRCQVTGNVNSGFTQSFYQVFNTAALGLAAPGTFGSSGVGILRQPTTWNTDATLDKRIPLKGERFVLRMRIEAYNLFNHTEFNAIGTTLGLSNGANVNSTWGQYISTLPSRVLSTTLRLQF